MGWDNAVSAGWSQTGVDSRQVRQVKQTPQNSQHQPSSWEPPNKIMGSLERGFPCEKKNLALGVPQVAVWGWETGAILTVGQAIQKQEVVGKSEQTEQPSASKGPTNNSFRPLREGLQILKPKKKTSKSWMATWAVHQQNLSSSVGWHRWQPSHLCPSCPPKTTSKIFIQYRISDFNNLWQRDSSSRSCLGLLGKSLKKCLQFKSSGQFDLVSVGNIDLLASSVFH